MLEHAHLQFDVAPDLEFVSVARRFVAEFYKRLVDADGVSRIALAAHELLENAVKYSIDGEATIRIDVDLASPRTVRITIRNRADAQDIAAIREILDGVSSAENPFAYYLQLITTRAKVLEGSAGLGLARICAEADMSITHRFIEGGLTEIEATASLGGAN